MRKFLLLSVALTGLGLGIGITKMKEKHLEKQKQSLKTQFEILNYQIKKQRHELQVLNYDLENKYSYFINSNSRDFDFGIGGYVKDVKILPYYEVIQENDKNLKINNALAHVLERKIEIEAEKASYIKDSLNHTPSIRPLPLDSIYAISSFGIRFHPILHKLMMHKGVDYAAKVGTPVYATADGIVSESSYDPISGQFIKIEHGFGYTTLYAHLSKRLVIKGEKVKKGQLIGYVGNTGRSVGPHLHYEVRVYGIPVNPLRFIANPIEAEQICAASSKRSKSIVLAR